MYLNEAELEMVWTLLIAEGERSRRWLRKMSGSLTDKIIARLFKVPKNENGRNEYKDSWSSARLVF